MFKSCNSKNVVFDLESEFPCDKVIEEVWKQKPRQTVVGVLWGKIAAHMASIQTV